VPSGRHCDVVGVRRGDDASGLLGCVPVMLWAYPVRHSRHRGGSVSSRHPWHRWAAGCHQKGRRRL